jgi:hypothetical protein
MNLFDDVLQRVSLLNAQLAAVQDGRDLQLEKLLYSYLWRLVEDLNVAFSLGLDNTALDLHTNGNALVIHYYAGAGGSMEQEVNIFIDRSLRWEKHTKDLSTGEVVITKHGTKTQHARNLSEIPESDTRARPSDLPVGLGDDEGGYG